MDLSIVIPVFNESQKIGGDVKASASFLSDNTLVGEIIVVDDGSVDNTADAAKEAGGNLPSSVTLNVIRYERNKGKGHAIRAGMKETSGEYVMFADSGGCVPYEEAFRGLELLRNDVCDIAHGSRKMHTSHIEKAQSVYRRICSAMFHWFVIHDMKIPAEFTDTQCGFKIYKGDLGRSLYGECITEGFMFDIEIIMRAQKQGLGIKEFPVDWRCDRDSRLSPSRNFWRVFCELMTIRRILGKD